MSPPWDLNLWDNLDEESVRLTQTSDFWIQVQSEADGLDIVQPASYSDSLQDSEEDWGIIQTPEEHKDIKVLHDCMWAGSCTDLQPSNTFVPTEFIPPGQSLLRRDMSPSRPDTPPSLDGDEPPQFRHAVDVANTARRLLRDSVVAVAADHSYTARQQFDCLGVQTPSDSGESEEEIDVVSVGTTTQQPLPAAPHVRTDSLPRSPSAQQQHHLHHTMLTHVSPHQRPVARKRLVPPPSIAAGQRRRARGPSRRGRRSNTDTDSEAEAPEMERRSIHNDMERLRRIGLKNLFDELKKQIPATREKERAPKVVILREAASLCRKLYLEDIERDKLKKKQNQLMSKLKKLRTMLAVRYRSY